MSHTPVTPEQPTPEPLRPVMEPASGVRHIKLQPHELISPVTATEDLFVLAHLGIPRVDPAQWRLHVDGLVSRPLIYDLDRLKALPKKIVEAVHQCCGSPLEPTVATRRVVNVRWGGVDLATLLDEAGVDPRANFVWSSGLDGGTFAGEPCDWFTKDLPLKRLAAGDVLVAYEVNGAPLPIENGFPVRLVVPGFFGTNSVKWLWRLRLGEGRSTSLFTTKFYNDPVNPADVAAGLPAQRPVWAQAPEAIIVSPAPETSVSIDETVEIWGWTWSFRGIVAVEISVDGGASFARAGLEERRGWAWQRYAFTWRPQTPGKVTLCARAIEAGGATQPFDGARNAVHAVHLTVR